MLYDHRDIPKAKRIVVKVGSSSITGENSANLAKLVEAIAERNKTGQQIVLVTSGAIATALPLMHFQEKPQDLATSQALAAIGQSRLMLRYQTELEKYDLLAGQVLLSATDLDNEESSNNAKEALEKLIELGVVPIVNENDTVATQEIRFGDNDRLAALVAILVESDALVLLSDVDALYDRSPTEEGSQKIEWVEPLDDLSGIKIGASSTKVGTGGAVTKIQAARTATDAGITVLLTSIDNVARVLSGERVGTWFRAKED
ncbi:MAG: glutamate 5-kinase [Rhodoluna sp.]